MFPLSERTTVYMDADFHEALRLKSITTERGISDLVNDAVRLALGKDAEDLAASGYAAFEENFGFKRFERAVNDLRQRDRI